MSASPQLPADEFASHELVPAQVDDTVEEWLAANQVPSASIALVHAGRCAYAKAYGAARIEPAVRAAVATRYPIYSISKQFTAAGILLLVEAGTLDLDDPAGRHLADLGSAAPVTIRQLLNHTGGVVDYWTMDYVPTYMRPAATHIEIIRQWAHRPLDFPPGTAWQYSNTGYVILGAILERLAGKSLHAFLEERVFAPLGMARVTQCDSAPLGPEDAGGHTRVGSGPIRPAPKEGPGWLFAACDLAMAASELAKWNIGFLAGSLLRPDLWQQALTPGLSPNARKGGYGFGLIVDRAAGRRRIGHDGIGSGYLCDNRVWPDDRAAITVLVNGDWADPSFLRERLTLLVLPSSERGRRVRDLFAAFQAGTVDRARLSANFNAFLTAEALADLTATLAALGPMRRLVFEHDERRGGMVSHFWKVVCAAGSVKLVERVLPDGSLEEFNVYRLQD